MKGEPGLGEVAPGAQDEDVARKLWEVSEELDGRLRFDLASCWTAGASTRGGRAGCVGVLPRAGGYSGSPV